MISSARKGMQIIQGINKNQPVLFTDLYIHHMHRGYNIILVLSITKVGLLRNKRRSLQSRNVLENTKRKMLWSNMQLVISSFKKKRKSSVEYEIHDNIDNEVDEYDLYELDKTSLDEKE